MKLEMRTDLRKGQVFINKYNILLTVILVVVILVFGLSTKRFLTTRNFSVIVSQSAEIGLMGLGMGLVTMINGVDLSVNDTANLSALMAGLFLKTTSRLSANLMPFLILVTISIAILTGTACGFLNGFLIGYLRVPPILATLGTMTLFRGISAGITRGKRLAGFPDQFSSIGRGEVFGIPVPFLILIICGTIIYFAIEYTKIGYKIRMVGTNPNAARFSGVADKSITMKSYIISGVLCSIAGIIIMSRTGSVAYEYGTQTYTLLSLAIVALANISPGFGSMISLILATIILQTISTGFYALLMTSPRGSFFKDLFWGVFLIVVLIIRRIVQKIGISLKRT